MVKYVVYIMTCAFFVPEVAEFEKEVLNKQMFTAVRAVTNDYFDD